MKNKNLKIILACIILVGLFYWDYLDMMQKLEPLATYELCKSILIQFKNLSIKAQEITEILNQIINPHEFTQEMKIESSNIQIMYNIECNDANLIVQYCHVLKLPVPTLTPEELAKIHDVPVDVINEIQDSINTFMSQNPSDHEIQEFIESIKQKYFL